MAIFQIQNFKFGLDSRRGELTSQPGTLEVLENAHVNQGAEIEKRKAFVEDGALSSDCFGLETVADGLVVFGSKVGTNFGSYNIIALIRLSSTTTVVVDSTCISHAGDAFTIVGCLDNSFNVTGVVSVGAGNGLIYADTQSPTVLSGSSVGTLLLGGQAANLLNYVRCAHPTDSTKDMTKVLCSCDFGGQAFCIAQFTNEIYWFLNGTVIPASYAGQVLSTAGSGTAQSVAQIVAQMYGILNTNAFSALGVHVESMTSTGFNIYTDYGITWDPLISVNHISDNSSGVIATALLSTTTEPVIGSSGPASLTLYAGSTGSLVSLTDTAQGVSKPYALISTPIPFHTNIGTTINDIAANINSQGGLLIGLAASSASNVLNITASVNLGPNYLTYQISSGSNFCFENMALDFSGVTTSPTVKNIYVSDGKNVIPTDVTYNGTGDLYGNPSGVLTGHKMFGSIQYGYYLWQPGANDVKLTINGGTVYLAINYPNGVVINYTSATFHLSGKANQPCTVSVITMNDILADSTGTPLSNPPTSAQITAIAAIITSKAGTNGGFVASNATPSVQPSGQYDKLYISRRNIAVNASSYSGIYFYTGIAGISPSGFASIIPPSSFGFGSSVNAVDGRGTTYKVTFSGTWIAGDNYLFDIVTPTTTISAGIGRLTGLTPTACITLSNRVHVIAGSNWLGSDNGDAMQWEQQAAGAFKVDVSQQFRQADALISLAAYQGRIALFANYVTMIFSLDANPNNISLVQAMANVGTFTSLGPQSLGDLDVIFPSITGFRSLRVRDLSLNAYVSDLGSPVDLLVQNDINAVGLSNLSTTCGIVEPSANRYWFYLNGKIYVLSCFPSAKIFAAWSTYTPDFFLTGVKTTFVPSKFVIYNSQVYFRASYGGADYLFVLGGLNNNTYDASVATAETSWLDLGTPGHRKQFEQLDYAQQAAWLFAASSDYYGYMNNSGQLKQINTAATDDPSFQLGQKPISMDGFHIKLQAKCSAASYATLSSLVLHYKKEDEK